MKIFLAAFDDVPDPRADNPRHDLCELLVVASVAVLCGANSCAEIAAFGRAKEHVFRGLLKLKHVIALHDTPSPSGPALRLALISCARAMCWWCSISTGSGGLRAS